MSDTHSRTIIPALGSYESPNDGWLRLAHPNHPLKGWFNWKQAPFYIEFDRGLGNERRAKYEKIVFEVFSFVEDLNGGVTPNISVDEDQIVSREEISEEDYRQLRN